jgi:hypothetical protein
MPILRSIVSIMHQRVSALWAKLVPTNAVNANHHSLTKMGLEGIPNAKETRIKTPAAKRTTCHEVMKNS